MCEIMKKEKSGNQRKIIKENARNERGKVLGKE